MQKPVSRIVCHEATVIMAKAMSKHLGITMPEVLFMAVGAMDKAHGLSGHRALVADAKLIRAKMREKVAREEAVRPVARGRRRAVAAEVVLKSQPLDFSQWDFASLDVGGHLDMDSGVQERVRGAACRYRAKHPGWNFKIEKIAMGLHQLIRTA